ncbi:hypothetical protein R50072_08050 [Simiduia litorea]|uniref:patatin-like phospholipase family protein n=1 Tax=Simiduia litorea TaxID=1435348 RepID=UPI0036F332A8
MEGSQFANEVFQAELDEISRRRSNVPGHHESRSTTHKDITTKNQLIGLACSGGGIRSASFSLGVIQNLITHKLFNAVDYLSTVSGGGYTGSCISALAKDNADAVRLLTDRSSQREPVALNHLRNYSEYLRTNGPLSGIRLPVLFTEGILRSILIFLPIVIFAAFITEAFFELAGTVSPTYQWITPLLGVLPLAISLTLRPIFKEKLQWQGRDKADGRLTIYAGMALASILAVPLFSGLAQIVHLNSASLFSSISTWVESHKVLISVAAAILAGLLLGAIFLWRARIVIPIAGFLAPASLAFLYVVICVEAINSPYIYDPQSLALIGEKPVQAQSFEKLQMSLTSPPEFGANIDCANSHIKTCQTLGYLLSRKNIDVKDFSITGYQQGSIELQRTSTLKNASLSESTGTADTSPVSQWFSAFSTRNPEKINIGMINEIGSDRIILEIEQLRLFKGHAEWWLYLLGVIVLLYNWLFVNINHFSLHPFYRDRLSRTFLITPSKDAVTTIETVKLSELSTNNSSAPYHIINTALNLQGSTNPQLRTRKTAPFILSKRYCGSDFTGYCPTKDMENADPHLNLAAAMAISAAAASPNMGTATVKPLSFMLTLLNIRLNYWLPHPGQLSSQSWLRKYQLKPLGLSYLLREALGLVNEKTPYVNCSDGGHIENLATYELLKRRCKTIVCIDAEADPTFSFAGLVTLQRYAAIDLGAQIDIDVSTIKPVQGCSASNFTVGKITYDNGEEGTLIYLKLSFTGKEPEYLHHYRHQHPNYPHQPTSDQYFDETQFEVYRALGFFVADSAHSVLADNLGEK